jgi:DNA repair ATPase RecN
VEINQSTKLDSQDLDVVLQRLDELETIQLELGDRNLLRDRVDEVLYQQSLIADELERLNRIEDKLMSLEEKLDLDQMSSDGEATPMSSTQTEGTPPAQPVGE